MSESKRRFRRDFLRRGSLMALGSAFGGVRAMVTIIALAEFGPTTVSTYGIAVNVYGIAVVLCAGHGIAVVSRLSHLRMRGQSDAAGSEQFTEIISTAWASTFVLVVLTCGFGAISTALIPGDRGQYVLAYAAATVGAILLPLGQCLAGKQQFLGLERLSTQHSFETFVIGTGLALLGTGVAPDATTALLSIGLSGIAAEAWGFARRRDSLGERDRGIIRAGWSVFTSSPAQTLRNVPRTAAGAYDGVVLLSTFALVSQLAASVGPLPGAVTVTAIAFVRSVVIPLKSIGLVGGRLVVHRSDRRLIDSGLIRQAIGTVAYVLVPVGAALALAPWPLQHVLGLPQGHDTELVVRLVGFQLMLEPIAGVGSAMLKVIVKPTAVLLPLTICMWGLTLPVIAIGSAAGALSLPTIWAVLLTARGAFCACVWVGLVRASRRRTELVA
ncbi:hypothetical protein SAMN06295909_3492 [Plantibacter sp. VKM Ac-1784]|uniref:O-antigen/teichoic acid export membrane protein n=2 Tax=Plantibacter elymi (nom. nud.) TaxID=199708 RepID=A0ABY1RGT7_9MICO|nr:hypothetical protein SAMN06295909_3492 [Plantibacter sp. VKM Ac-1784]